MREIPRTSALHLLCLSVLAACVPLILGAGCPGPADSGNPSGDQVVPDTISPDDSVPVNPDSGQDVPPDKPVPIAGDFNGDNVVDQADVDILIAAFNSTQGDARFNAAVDLNGDGSIDLLDIQIMNNLVKGTGG